jgi:hypothetical protein
MYHHDMSSSQNKVIIIITIIINISHIPTTSKYNYFIVCSHVSYKVIYGIRLSITEQFTLKTPWILKGVFTKSH